MVLKKELLALYAKAPLGAGISAFAAAGGVALFMALFPMFGLIAGGAWGALAAVALGALGHGVSLASGAASKSAVRERDRRAWLALKPDLDALALDARRLGAMRVPDERVRQLAQAASLAGGRYLDACRRAKSAEPAASAALRECLEVVDAFLAELDQSSTERRFDLPDADPFAAPADRSAAALSERIARMDRATLDLGGGLSARDELSLKEELR